MNTSRHRRLALFGLLLCLGAGFVAWVTWTVASRILVDSTGRQFAKINIATDASLDLGNMPMNAIALSDRGEPMALKMLEAPRVTIQRGLRLPSITAVWLQKTNVPDDLTDGPPLLQQLTVFDCSIADESLLKLTKSSSLTDLDLVNDPTLTSKAVGTVLNRHKLTHLGLAGLSALDSSQFEVAAASTIRLRSLRLNGGTIDDAILRQLAAGGQLSALHIDNAAVTEDGIAFAIQNNSGTRQRGDIELPHFDQYHQKYEGADAAAQSDRVPNCRKSRGDSAIACRASRGSPLHADHADPRL